MSDIEEQEHCKFCHSDKDRNTDLFDCKNDDCCASIDLDENKITFDNSDGHFMYGEFKINYCPMCGRKLEVKS